MGNRILLSGTEARPPHGAGTVITYNNGVDQVQVYREPPAGLAVRWQTGGNDNIWFFPGTELRPMTGSQAGKIIATVQSDGYLRSAPDPDAASLPAATVPPPVYAAAQAPPPPAPKGPDVIQLLRSQYQGKTAAEMEATYPGYTYFPPLAPGADGSMVRNDSPVIERYRQAQIAAQTARVTPAVTQPSTPPEFTAATDFRPELLPEHASPAPPPPPPPPEETEPGGNGESGAGGLPIWVWIAGGAALLYAMSRR